MRRIAAVLFLVAPFAVVSATGDDAAVPVAIIRSFNEAITHRDLAAALSLLAPGAVKFTLHPAHAGVPPGPGGAVTSDLKAHWSQVGSLLFMATKSYTRVAAPVDARVDGELATVWARTATDTIESNGSARAEKFVELYLLVLTPNGWKIGAIADNRATK